MATITGALAAGRLAHGWLITGPPGVGKATFAYRVARRLLAAAADAEACDDPGHRIFRMVAKSEHPDLHVLEQEYDKRRRRLRGEILIGQVRHVIDRLRLAPMMGGRRVLILDPADGLNRNAVNALLKLLEEPPADTVMLLVVQRPGDLPATIASRCARLRLRPLSQAMVCEGLLLLDAGLDAATAERCAALAQGSIGRALELARGGWLEAYAALVVAVAAAGSLAGRLRVAELLAERARAETPEAAAELLGELLRRAALTAAGQAPAIELIAGEAAVLAAIAGAGLDRVVGAWDKLRMLTGPIAALNLDPLPAFLQATQGLAAPGERRPQA